MIPKMKQTVLAVLLSSLVILACPFPADPPSGAWLTDDIDFDGDLPFDPDDLDPDALFDVINQGNGELLLDRLSDVLPDVIRDNVS